MGLPQTKNFCTAKETINKIKRQLTGWENMFANTSDKRLLSKIYKVLLKLNPQNQIVQFKNGQRNLNRHFSDEDIEMANRHMKRYSPSLIPKD